MTQMDAVRVRRAGLVVALLVTLTVMAVGLAAPAGAHAFEIENRPADGARLDATPRQIELAFSESVVTDAVLVTVRSSTDQPITTGTPVLSSQDRVARVTLPPLDDDIYAVSWQVVAVADGHLTAGAFAFAVGQVDAEFLTRPAPTPPLDTRAAVSSWLVLAGFALAGGGLLARWRLPFTPEERIRLDGQIRWGTVVALAGAGLTLAVTSGGGGLGSTAGLATLVVVGLLAAGLVPTVGVGARALTVVGAGLAWSARGHAAAYGGVIGFGIDALHLGAATAWAGALAAVVVVQWRRYGALRGEASDATETTVATEADAEVVADADAAAAHTPVGLVAAYARLAIWLLSVAVVTGALSATGLLRAPSDLLETAYGRSLAVKAAVVAGVSGLAIIAHRRGLRRGRVGMLRRMTSAEVAGVGVVLALSAVLAAGGPPVALSIGGALLPAAPLGEPLSRAAGLAGGLNVTVAATAGLVRIEVFGPSGPVEPDTLTVDLRGPDGNEATLLPRPCGEGCFQQDFALDEGQTDVTVDVVAPQWDPGAFTGALAWPPARVRPALLRRVIDVMRSVEELDLVERVDSGPQARGIETTAQLTGAQFVTLAPYAAAEVTDVRRSSDGRGIDILLPAARIFVTLELDDQGRIVTERIISPGHQIQRELDYPSGQAR